MQVVDQVYENLQEQQMYLTNLIETIEQNAVDLTKFQIMDTVRLHPHNTMHIHHHHTCPLCHDHFFVLLVQIWRPSHLHPPILVGGRGLGSSD